MTRIPTDRLKEMLAGWSSGTEGHAIVSELLALRAAVNPFAALGQYILDEDLQTKPDDRAIWGFDRNELTYGDFRRAARSINGGFNV